jgi:hypothetical protein
MCVLSTFPSYLSNMNSSIPATASVSCADWKIEFPVLSLRKDIWTHFPVILKPLGAGQDGAERHAVMWHRKRLVEWRKQHTSDKLTWMNYESVTEFRLMKSLRDSARWVVEPATDSTQICILRMLYGDQAPLMQRADLRALMYEQKPVLTCLNDIKMYFPVVWHRVDDNKRLYSIELYEKKITEPCTREAIVEKLMNALRASSSWTVLPPVGTSGVCVLDLLA